MVPFNLSLLDKEATFALLTRYYVVSKVTGAHHLFRVRSSPNLREKFFSSISTDPHFHQQFHKPYLLWYMDFIYKQVGLAPPGKRLPSVEEVLGVAPMFWKKCYGE